jgi:hypothetical protein
MPSSNDSFPSRFGVRWTGTGRERGQGRFATRSAQRVVGRTADNLPVRSRRRLPVLALTTLLPLLLAIASATSATSVQQGRAMSPTVVTAPIAPVAPTPVGVAGSWAMKFSDEFNGTALNTTKWQPGWFGSGITPPVNSAEKQCFDARQATVSGGALHLALVARALTCGGVKRSYASGMVTSNPDALGAGKGYQFTNGVVEYRVFIPSDAAGRCANWPAVWSNGQNWPTTGEIDTYECLSSNASWHLHCGRTGCERCRRLHRLAHLLVQLAAGFGDVLLRRQGSRIARIHRAEPALPHHEQRLWQHHSAPSRHARRLRAGVAALRPNRQH